MLLNLIQLCELMGHPCLAVAVLKVRAQASTHGTSGMVPILRGIVKHEGWATLGTGAGPSALRASVMTASQCVGYDESKRWLVAQGLADGLVSHTLYNIQRFEGFKMGRHHTRGLRGALHPSTLRSSCWVRNTLPNPEYKSLTRFIYGLISLPDTSGRT